MTISLLLYSLLQRRIRLNLKEKNEYVPNQKRKAYQLPTMRWVNMNFEGVDVTKIYSNGAVKYYFHRMNPFVEKILDVLGEQFKNRYSENWLC